MTTDKKHQASDLIKKSKILEIIKIDSYLDKKAVLKTIEKEISKLGFIILGK